MGKNDASSCCRPVKSPPMRKKAGRTCVRPTRMSTKSTDSQSDEKARKTRMQAQLTQEAKIASDASLVRAIFAFSGFVSALTGRTCVRPEQISAAPKRALPLFCNSSYPHRQLRLEQRAAARQVLQRLRQRGKGVQRRARQHGGQRALRQRPVEHRRRLQRHARNRRGAVVPQRVERLARQAHVQQREVGAQLFHAAALSLGQFVEDGRKGAAQRGGGYRRSRRVVVRRRRTPRGIRRFAAQPQRERPAVQVRRDGFAVVLKRQAEQQFAALSRLRQTARRVRRRRQVGVVEQRHRQRRFAEAVFRRGQRSKFAQLRAGSAGNG